MGYEDGSMRDILWSNTAILDESGNVQYFISAGMDITERKKPRRLEANEKLRALIHASPLAVITLDSEGRITSWSSASSVSSGGGKKKFWDYFSHDPGRRARSIYNTA